MTSSEFCESVKAKYKTFLSCFGYYKHHQMEKDKQSATALPLEFNVSTYAVKVVMDKQKIYVKAYSELHGRLLEAIVEEKDLTEADRIILEDCEGVYSTIEECLQQKQVIQLSDVGELRFPYHTGPAKKRVQRTLELRLKEVEMGDSQRLAMKVERLEAYTKEQ